MLLLCNRDEDREQVADFLLRFSRLYDCKFTMINIRNIYPENRHAVHVHNLSDRFALIEHCFCDVHPKSGHEFVDGQCRQMGRGAGRGGIHADGAVSLRAA